MKLNGVLIVISGRLYSGKEKGIEDEYLIRKGGNKRRVQPRHLHREEER